MFLSRAWEVIGVVATAVGLVMALSASAQAWLLEHAVLLSAGLGVIAGLAGAGRLFQPSEISFVARGRALQVEVKVEDLFAATGSIVIPMNDFFDTSLGAVVEERSVHGQFLKLQYPNREAEARLNIDNALASKTPIEVVARAPAASRRFKVGETTVMPIGDRRFILFALTETVARTHKTQSTLTQYVNALECLWEQVRDCCNHGDVSVPLMGTKTARVGVDKKILIDLILTSAIRADSVQPIANRITLVLRPDDLAEVDLLDIRRRFA